LFLALTRKNADLGFNPVKLALQSTLDAGRFALSACDSTYMRATILFEVERAGHAGINAPKEVFAV
jgi:hypothetical protein